MKKAVDETDIISMLNHNAKNYCSFQ